MSRPKERVMTKTELVQLDRFRAEKRALNKISARWPDTLKALQKLAYSQNDVALDALPYDFANFIRWLLINAPGTPGVYLDSIGAAANRGDGKELAREALKLHHALVEMPRYALRARYGDNARKAAAVRKAEGKNVGAFVEALEREIGRRLSPQSKSDIQTCAAKSRGIGRKRKGYSKETIRSFLYARNREVNR